MKELLSVGIGKSIGSRTLLDGTLGISWRMLISWTSSCVGYWSRLETASALPLLSSRCIGGELETNTSDHSMPDTTIFPRHACCG